LVKAELIFLKMVFMENSQNIKTSNQLLNQLSTGELIDLHQDIEKWTDEDWFKLQKKLEKILHKKGITQEEIEDTVSETLTTLWEIRKGPEENRIYSALAVLRYKWLSLTKRLGKQKQEVQIDGENPPELISPVDNPGRMLLDKEKVIDYKKCAAKCLQRLPPHKRYLFVACNKLEYGSVKRKMIADHLEITVETLNKRVSRIIKDLRKCGVECMQAKGYSDNEIPLD
jgi:DNA-directed RNA polymerase specialized sigma24 family protein